MRFHLIFSHFISSCILSEGIWYWDFHELYLAIDLQKIPRCPNNCSPKWLKYIPKFDGDVPFVAQHISSFFKAITKLNIMHEDVLMKLFVFSLEGYSNTWIKHCCRPKKIYSLADLFKVFLKHWVRYYEAENYKEILKDVMTTFHKDEEAPPNPMKDQAHKEHMGETSFHVLVSKQEPPQDSIEYKEEEGEVPCDLIKDQAYDERVDEDHLEDQELSHESIEEEDPIGENILPHEDEIPICLRSLQNSEFNDLYC